MSIGHLLSKSVPAAILVSACLGLAASAENVGNSNNVTQIANATKLTVVAPGAPVYFEKTFSTPSKILIRKSKNGEPDFANMSESNAVRLACGPGMVDDLIPGVGLSTQFVGFAWGFSLLALCLMRMKNNKLNVPCLVFSCLTLAAALVIPFLLIPVMYICFFCWIFKLGVNFLWFLLDQRTAKRNSTLNDMAVEAMPGESAAVSGESAVASVAIAPRSNLEVLERCYANEFVSASVDFDKEEADLCLLK